jgi:hypothetical protein
MDFISTVCHEILEHGGPGTFVIALLALVMFHLGIIIAFSKFDTDNWPSFFRRLVMVSKGTKRELSNSTFFQSMLFLKVGVIPRMNIKCKLRKKIFSRLLYIKLDILESTVKDFISKQDSWKDMEVDDLEIVLKSVLAEADVKYQKECLDRGIPEIALDLFKKYNLEKLDILDEVLISAALSKYTCSTNQERVLLFLDSLSVRENKAFTAMEKVLDTLNGVLSKVVFEGECCTQCDPNCPFKAISQQ